MAKIWCVIALLTLAQVLCVYAALNLVVDRTVHVSEECGYHNRKTFNRLLSQMTVLKTQYISVETVNPDWEIPVAGLGDPMSLVVSYKMNLPCLGGDIGVTLHVKCDGVNTGYYGAGY